MQTIPTKHKKANQVYNNKHSCFVTTLFHVDKYRSAYCTSRFATVWRHCSGYNHFLETIFVRRSARIRHDFNE